MKSVIGICPLYDDDKNSIWMLPYYQKILEEQNAATLILPYTDDLENLDTIFDLCDGLLLTGGHDVDPKIYGSTKSDKCGTINPIRDHMECHLIERAYQEDKAVLGICRGIQIMNAYLGGSLYQDLPSEFKSSINHTMSAPYDRVVHRVDIIKGSVLDTILNQESIGVNSYHHQAIKTLSPKMEACAISEDGLIESAIVKDKKFMLALQWHPEYNYLVDDNSKKIVKAFVNACN